jgi:hypothetical protein
VSISPRFWPALPLKPYATQGVAKTGGWRRHRGSVKGGLPLTIAAREFHGADISHRPRQCAQGRQIAFYLIGATVAVLTYRAAKRGLLNTVATEYQKRVMDRLQRLSEDLYGEFDMASPTHWSRVKPVHGAIEHINEVFFRWKDDILATRRYDYGTPVTPDVLRLTKWPAKNELSDFS